MAFHETSSIRAHHPSLWWAQALNRSLSIKHSWVAPFAHPTFLGVVASRCHPRFSSCHPRLSSVILAQAGIHCSMTSNRYINPIRVPFFNKINVPLPITLLICLIVAYQFLIFRDLFRMGSRLRGNDSN